MPASTHSHGMSGVPGERSGPGYAERGRRRKALESPLHLPVHPPPVGPRREGRGRARLILNRRPALVRQRPGADLCPVREEALFHMASLPSPPASSLQPLAVSPFRRAVSGPGLSEAYYHPPGFPTSQSAPTGGKGGRGGGGASPAPSLSRAPGCVNLPPGPGVSRGMRSGRQAPSLHSSGCGQPRLRALAGGVGRLLSWGVVRVQARPYCKAIAGRLQHTAHLQTSM